MIQLEVWGPYALFSRPELKTERMSYDIITPSAARGLVEAIYFHPGLRWHIDRIYLLRPFGEEDTDETDEEKRKKEYIRFASVRRNEVKNKILASSVRSAAGSGQPLYQVTSQEIVQRASLVLRDVHYVIEAHFDMTDKAAPGDNPGKFQDIVTRRMEKGQCFHTPYFGCREFPASFRRWQGGEIPAVPLTRDLGLMLYDFDYSDPAGIRPLYFRAKLVDGVLDLRDCEVFR